MTTTATSLSTCSNGKTLRLLASAAAGLAVQAKLVNAGLNTMTAMMEEVPHVWGTANKDQRLEISLKMNAVFNDVQMARKEIQDAEKEFENLCVTFQCTDFHNLLQEPKKREYNKLVEYATKMASYVLKVARDDRNNDSEEQQNFVELMFEDIDNPNNSEIKSILLHDKTNVWDEEMRIEMHLMESNDLDHLAETVREKLKESEKAETFRENLKERNPKRQKP